MKKIIFIFSVLALIVACKNQEKKVTPLSLTEQDAIIKDSANFTTVTWVDSTFKDIGKVKKGQIVEVPFTVKNTGNKPLVIASVTPGCGCTVAEKPEEPILPGKEEKIIAKFNSASQSIGTYNKNVVVKANTKPFTEHVLNFKVEVVE